MRILQITTNVGRGGPGGVVKDLYDYLTDKGHSVRILYGRYDSPNGMDAIKLGEDVDVYVHALIARVFDNAGFMSVKSTRILIRQIQEYKPDIIHLHNLLGYYVNVEMLFNYIKMAGIPIVWTLHDCWAFTGHCINFERIHCKKFIQGCSKCELKKDYPQSMFLDNSQKNYFRKKKLFNGVSNMVLVTPSNWLSGLVKQSFLHEYRCEVFYNGIDLDVFKPTESTIKKDKRFLNKKIILFVASTWNEMKGEHLVYEIAKLLDDSYSVVMIGKKTQKRLPKEIINIEKTTDIHELVKWYSAADVFVNPTLGDNFPTVNIEALACGTPVVTNRTGGSPEAAGNYCGKVVDSKTAEEIVEKIEECLQSNISKNECRELALKFDRNRCFGKYLDLYVELKSK